MNFPFPTSLKILACIAIMALEWEFVSLSDAADPVASPTLEANGQVRKFELDIQPILTARGCNAGPCHGKARGQNGFALSLLGFDANMDYEAIVKNARGRRLSLASPEESLLLTKATGKQPHGGGIRFSEADDDYQLLLDWIQTGTRRTEDADPQLLDIQIAPVPHSLTAGQSEKLTITATYSDGSSRDVPGCVQFCPMNPLSCP